MPYGTVLFYQFSKNEKNIDKLMNEIITDIDIQLSIADMDNTKLISLYFSQE